MDTAAASTIRVLHVDDDGDFAELTATFLEREDDRLTVQTATSAAAGLERLEEDVDGVVSDYDMPGDNGIEFLEAVRERYPDLPFILFTGKGSETVASDAISAGVTDYLQKETGSDQYALLANRLLNAVEHYDAEREIRTTRQRFSALFENSPEPTLIYEYVDDEPVIRDINDAFVDVFGYDTETAVNEPVDDLVVPTGLEDEAKDIDRRVREGEFVDEELRRRTVDGDRFFKFRNIPIPGEEGADGFGVYIDIGDRKARERELERQNERLETFTTVVSHDLRNPLTVASDSLTLGREQCDNEHFETAADALDRMDDLVEDLLTLARQGESVGDREAIGLDDLATECWATVRTEGATLEGVASLTVRADRTRLRQLLENLLANAVEHGGETVTVGRLVEDAGFYVADDGPGIPEPARETVFEGGYTTRDDGTGFGLTIVREVAEAHGWSVAVTESDAGGARVEVRDVSGES